MAAVKNANRPSPTGPAAPIRHFVPPELAAEIRASRKPVVLLGAAEVARLTVQALAGLGVPVTVLCDFETPPRLAAWPGNRLVAPSDLVSFDPDAYVFLCGDYRLHKRSHVFDLLERLPFRRIYECVDLLDGAELDARDLGLTPIQVRRLIARHRAEVDDEGSEASAERLVLRSLDVVVTETCSMRCRDCSNLMQYYTRARHADFETISKSIRRLMRSVDRIEEFRVLGGEPFMNREMHRTVELLSNLAGAGWIVVYTNATIVPRGENLKCLRHPRVMVEITNYAGQSRNHDALIETFERMGVEYVSKVPIWTDSGRIVHLGRDPAELARVFRDCCVNDLITLLHGKLHRCPFSANAVNLGAVPDGEKDAIDVLAESTDATLREQVREMYRRQTPLAACSYCNGRDASTPKIPSALQVSKPLPLPDPVEPVRPSPR